MVIGQLLLVDASHCCKLLQGRRIAYAFLPLPQKKNEKNEENSAGQWSCVLCSLSACFSVGLSLLVYRCVFTRQIEINIFNTEYL
jgi:hypothetical protein